MRKVSLASIAGRALAPITPEIRLPALRLAGRRVNVSQYYVADRSMAARSWAAGRRCRDQAQSSNAARGSTARRSAHGCVAGLSAGRDGLDQCGVSALPD